MTAPVYVACVEGQGGMFTSPGIPLIANRLRAEGVSAEPFQYSDVTGITSLMQLARKDAALFAAVGYSLGCSAATWLQTYYPVDLLLCIAASSWGQNYPLNKKNTKRAVLWYGDDWLSDAMISDPGWDAKHHVQNILSPIPLADHLSMDLDPTVINGVLAELAKLKSAPGGSGQ